MAPIVKPASLKDGLGSKFTGIVETLCCSTLSSWHGHRECGPKLSCKGDRTESQQVVVWAPGSINCRMRRVIQLCLVFMEMKFTLFIASNAVESKNNLQTRNSYLWRIRVTKLWTGNLCCSGVCHRFTSRASSDYWVDRQTEIQIEPLETNKLTREKNCCVIS